MSDDFIRMICPNLRCRAILSVPHHTRGKTVRCRGCSTRIQVPAHPSKPVAKPAAESADSES